MILDLTQGVVETSDYHAFVFPGGEVHFKLKKWERFVETDSKIIARLNSSDDIMLLALAIDSVLDVILSRDRIEVIIPYMAYQQADRRFSVGESYSLNTIRKLLTPMLTGIKLTIFDAHSDVTQAMFPDARIVSNANFITGVLEDITFKEKQVPVMLSPDAGAYKKIHKLADTIGFKGEVASANKYRSISTGNIESLELSTHDFEGQPVLIVDDICMGGWTFIQLFKKLKEHNVGNVYLAISHGIFSNGIRPLQECFAGVYTTNSRIGTHSLIDNEDSFVQFYDVITELTQ